MSWVRQDAGIGHRFKDEGLGLEVFQSGPQSYAVCEIGRNWKSWMVKRFEGREVRWQVWFDGASASGYFASLKDALVETAGLMAEEALAPSERLMTKHTRQSLMREAAWKKDHWGQRVVRPLLDWEEY